MKQDLKIEYIPIEDIKPYKNNAKLMEYDPKYVDVIIDRWEKFTGQKAVKLN